MAFDVCLGKRKLADAGYLKAVIVELCQRRTLG